MQLTEQQKEFILKAWDAEERANKAKEQATKAMWREIAHHFKEAAALSIKPNQRGIC